MCIHLDEWKVLDLVWKAFLLKFKLVFSWVYRWNPDMYIKIGLDIRELTYLVGTCGNNYLILVFIWQKNWINFFFSVNLTNLVYFFLNFIKMLIWILKKFIGTNIYLVWKLKNNLNANTCPSMNNLTIIRC
jgi:hypothetical protein